jgi:hypothetical protein
VARTPRAAALPVVKATASSGRRASAGQAGPERVQVGHQARPKPEGCDLFLFTKIIFHCENKSSKD